MTFNEISVAIKQNILLSSVALSFLWGNEKYKHFVLHFQWYSPQYAYPVGPIPYQLWNTYLSGNVILDVINSFNGHNYVLLDES